MSIKISKKMTVILLLMATAVCMAALYRAWRAGRVYTDNAYVHGDTTHIMAKVGGYVVEVLVDDNQPVKAGDLLFRIEPEDYEAHLAQTAANVAYAQAKKSNIDASIELQHAVVAKADAELTAAKAVMSRTRQEYARQSRLRKNMATTEQKYEDALSSNAQAEAAVSGAEANLKVQTQTLKVLGAELEAAKATVGQAEAQQTLAALNLDYTRVRAPSDGVVGNRKVTLGRYVSPGASMLDIVPVRDVWIVANFKENQLEHMRPGQRATVTVDGYPGAAINGEIDSLAPGSGAAFSLMPPDNATGNFVRVVQRVPVKIRFKENPLVGLLVPGLSCRVAVSVE